LRLAAGRRAKTGVRLIRLSRIAVPVAVLLIAAIVFLAKVVFAAGTLAMIPAIAGAIMPAIATTVVATTAILARLVVRIVAIAPLVLRAVEAAHGIDHAQVMFGVLIIGFSRNPITHRRCFARKDLVLLEDLVRVAPHPNLRTTAIEGLITLRLVVRFTTATAATTTAVAAALAATLIIVRSHIRLLPK
jgi:hypothetical protein